MTESGRQFNTYQHYKGGIYVKLCEALGTEDEQTYVVYTCVLSGRTYCRPKAMFEEVVTTPGYTGPRFIPLPQTTTKTQRQSLRYDPTETPSV